jgi:hypothetical protein
VQQPAVTLASRMDICKHIATSSISVRCFGIPSESLYIVACQAWTDPIVHMVVHMASFALDYEQIPMQSLRLVQTPSNTLRRTSIGVGGLSPTA